MMRRSESAVFGSGAFVFPGGRVDEHDNDPQFEPACAELTRGEANRVLGLERDGLGYWVAAIRECFEEAGLMLAYDESGRYLQQGAQSPHLLFASERERLIDHGMSFLQLVQRFRLKLATDTLAYLGHWITQAGRPRRFDTRFFVAPAPAGQAVSHDGSELVQHVWIRPQQALEQHQAGEFLLMFPTMRTLESLLPFSRVGDVLAFARAPRRVSAITPIPAMGRSGPELLVPGDHAFAEVAKLDPEGRGTASCELQVGCAVALSSRIRRLTAPRLDNSGLAGVNTYLIGSPSEGIAVIDPGPDEATHIEAILAASGAAIRWILFTHSHAAHAAGAHALARRSPGAIVLGTSREEPSGRIPPVPIGRPLADGETVGLGAITLRVVHTPGHTRDHVCFVLMDENIIFTGDHLSQGPVSASVARYEGSMLDFIDSFARLRPFELEYIAPGHGFLMKRPHEMFDRALNERLGRENRVLKALREAHGGTEDELLEAAFQDVPASARPRWRSTLLAHLDKLAAEGRAVKAGARWRPLPRPAAC